MAKSLHCAETTHSSKAALRTKVLHIEEMRSLKYFLNHHSIHAPLSHMRLCLSFSILPFKSVKDGDHFDMHLGY